MASLDESGVQWLMDEIKRSFSIDLEQSDQKTIITQGNWRADISPPIIGAYIEEDRAIDFSGGAYGREEAS